MEINLAINFINLILALQYRKTYQKVDSYIKQNCQLKTTNVQNLTPYKILQLYRSLKKKFYVPKLTINHQSWYENEQKIFIWLMLGYLYIHKKKVDQMQMQDWQYFKPIFLSKSIEDLQFQALLLRQSIQSKSWSKPQIQLLSFIIINSNLKNKWNLASKQLYLKSNKMYFRTPKQCRQRWLNYLDPQLKKTCWQFKQDLILLKMTLQYGKKWAKIVKVLQMTRTEHMVKNRYKSLINFDKRLNTQKSQQKICQQKIQQLLRKINKNNLNLSHKQQKYQIKSSLNESKGKDIYISRADKQTILQQNLIDNQQLQFEQEQNDFLIEEDLQNCIFLQNLHQNQSIVQSQIQ